MIDDASSLARAKTGQLIDSFISLGQIAGNYLNPARRKPPNFPGRDEIVKLIHSIAGELRRRKPVQDLRERLFDHLDADVRAWASGQFMSTDPEWSSAASAGLSEGLSTREVLALIERAKAGPPKQPKLSEMTIDELLTRFEDAGMRDYATRFMGTDDCSFQDIELHNEITLEALATADELAARGSLPRLLPFLDHPNITIRNHAAHFCLKIAPDRAVPVLEAIKKSGDSCEFVGAMTSLDHYRGEGFYGPEFAQRQAKS